MEYNIFPFNDRPALQVQDGYICQELYLDFWTKILNCDDKLGISKQNLSRIKDSCSSLYWLARYASVVLIRPLDSTYSSISMVGLDGWQSVIHASVDGRESTAIPDVSSPAFYQLGPSPIDEIDELLKKLQDALAESESNNTGNMRGQHAGHQGNQKTPSFARTVLWQVMNDTKDRLSIQGGTTDVGLHTGCVRRNTSFPLVLSAVYTILRLEGEEPDQVFHKCVSNYLLAWLKEVALRVTDFSARSVDHIVTIIREIEVHLKSLDDVEFVDAAVGVIEEHHTRLVALRPGADTKSPTLLHVNDSVPTICDMLWPPQFPEIPDLSATSNVQSQMNQARSDAKKNLVWIDISSTEFTGELQDAWLQLSRLNRFFWKMATELEKKDVVHDIGDLCTKLAHFSEQTALASEDSLQTTHVMTVVLSSSELIATWICFCWAHRTAEEQHPVFGKYGAALDPADLRHIVLDDAGAIRAVECVRRFLGKRFEKPARPFRSTEDTLKLALEYGSSSKRLCDMHSEELRAANELIEERWKQVAKTQTKLSVLDSKLENAHIDLSNARERLEESKLRDFNYDRHGRKVFDQVYYDTRNNENQGQKIVYSLTASIQVLERKPPNLELGLPRYQERSLQWLFFLFMPIEFRHLSALAQLAQSKLWKNAPSAVEPSQNLFSWFRSRRKVHSIPVNEAKLHLGTQSEEPRISTPGIRDYVQETGVFFPDSFSIDPMWDDRDPFASGRTDTETTIMFTELLPQQVDQSEFMQKFVAMLPTKRRENEGIARRERKPEWLTQEQYVTFTTLRAGPYAQVRLLVEALQDNLLP
jgi:hypothetical protein